MTPLDDELRTLFHDRAGTVSPATDPLTGVQARARTLRRRRSVGSALASAAAVVAVVLAVPAVLPSGADSPDPGTLAGGSSPSAPAPSATAPGAPASAVLDWRLQGDAAIAERMLPFVLRTFEPRGGPTTRVKALYARADGVSDVLIAQVRSDSMPARTVVAVAGQDSTKIYYDAPTPVGTLQVSTVVPASTSSQFALLIVSDPAVPARQSVTADGAVLLAGVPSTAGEVALPEGTVPQRLNVTLRSEAGQVIYDGVVTYDGTPGSEPSAYATTFVDWGTGDFGSVERTVAPLALERWTAEHPGRQGTTIRYLQCCAVGPNPTLEVAQVQDSTGAVWNYATVSTDTDRSVVLDERSPRNLTHIAVVMKLNPGSPPQVLLITAPDVTEVAYARDGTTFVSQQRDQSSPARAGGRAPAVYGFLRTGDPQLDQLRIRTAGSPTPSYEGPVD